MRLKMIGKVIFCLSTLHIYRVVADPSICTDIRGREIAHGLHFVPGPNNCLLCICDDGQSIECKAILCAQPQDCRSFRLGRTCCEYICLDVVVNPPPVVVHTNVVSNVPIIVGGSAILVILTIIIAVYSIKKKKRPRPSHGDDQRSMTSIGYISGSMAYGGNCETGLSAWKPPSNYMPRGEAPPPYEEVVAQSRAEVMRLNSEQAFIRIYPPSVESCCRGDESMQCSNQNYMHMPRPVTQVANTQSTCFNAPLLQSMHTMEPRDQPSSMPHHQPSSMPHHHPISVNGFPNAIRLTGSLGTITNRGLLSLLQREPPPDHERPHNVPGFYSNTGALALHSSLHRTIPRISTAVDTTVLDTALSNFNRSDRLLHHEIRRSFHKPNENNRHGHNDTGRSMPRNLNLASNSELSRSIDHNLVPPEGYAPTVQINPGRSRAHSEEQDVGSTEGKLLNKSLIKSREAPPPEGVISAPPTTLPLTVDKPSCVCSYDEVSAPGAEEPDDYRSECENCKSAGSSRWVLEEGWSEAAEEGTQTLLRHAPPQPAPPPATATLPQPVTKQRMTMGPPSNWENWFNTIPDSDTESEEE